MKLVGSVDLGALKAEGRVRLPYPPFDILVVWTDETPLAIEDACNHAGASMEEGEIENGCITCPMHGYVFDLRSGELLRPKGMCSAQRTYVARVEGERVAIYDDFKLFIG